MGLSTHHVGLREATRCLAAKPERPRPAASSCHSSSCLSTAPHHVSLPASLMTSHRASHLSSSVSDWNTPVYLASKARSLASTRMQGGSLGIGKKLPWIRTPVLKWRRLAGGTGMVRRPKRWIDPIGAAPKNMVPCCTATKRLPGRPRCAAASTDMDRPTRQGAA
jgi:hypothetical protein